MQNQMVAMLKNTNEIVVQSSLEALFFLSNNPSNRKPLAETKGLPEALSGLSSNQSQSLRSVADATLINLKEHITPALQPSTNAKRKSVARGEPSVKLGSGGVVSAIVEDAVCSEGCVQGARIAAKTFCIHVPAAQLEERAYLDKQVVRYPGVISVQVRSPLLYLLSTITLSVCEN